MCVPIPKSSPSPPSPRAHVPISSPSPPSLRQSAFNTVGVSGVCVDGMSGVGADGMSGAGVDGVVDIC